jgi:hypothetical protein
MRAAGLVMVMAFICTGASAQYGVVSEAEFKTACGITVPVPMRTRAESYRMTLETKSAMEGRPSSDYTSRSITSFQDRTRWHRLSESSFGATKRLTEEISFGGKTYKKTGDGEWIELDLSTAPAAPVSAKSQIRYLSIEYRLLPDETLNGQKVRVCEKYEIAAVKMAQFDSQTRRESTSRYWVNDDGLLKSENTYRNVSEKNTTTSWIKNEWEIDPTIKVSLPAKFAQKQ